MSEYAGLTTKQQLMQQTISQLLARYDGTELSDILDDAMKIVNAVLSDDKSEGCTAPKDPDRVLTGDEIKRLAETGSLCDCQYFEIDGTEHPIEKGDEFDFGTATHLMKLGNRVQRAGWNGKGMFVYYVPAASYPADRNSKSTMAGEFADDMVPYREYLALKTAQNDVSTWAPSVSDALATDWQLLK